MPVSCAAGLPSATSGLMLPGVSWRGTLPCCLIAGKHHVLGYPDFDVIDTVEDLSTELVILRTDFLEAHVAESADVQAIDILNLFGGKCSFHIITSQVYFLEVIIGGNGILHKGRNYKFILVVSSSIFSSLFNLLIASLTGLETSGSFSSSLPVHFPITLYAS